MERKLKSMPLYTFVATGIKTRHSNGRVVSYVTETNNSGLVKSRFEKKMLDIDHILCMIVPIAQHF
jgi:hypothetical protein